MKAIRISFLQMVYFIKQDMMLFAACLAPLMTGLFFKLAIPILERVLIEWLSQPTVLTPYYGLFDMLLAMITSVMFCFITAMVILEETDDRITRYLFITPLGKIGYLASRFGVSAVIAFIITMILLPIFKLTELTFVFTAFLSVGGTLQGIMISLLVVTFSSNKLEGIAVSKLSTIAIIGIAVPYLLQHKIQYVLSPLPSFWIGKSIYHNESIYMFFSIALSLIWIAILLKKFLCKIS